MLLIFWQVIAPILVMMGVGFIVQKRLGLDIKSLTRLNFWIFIPAFLFVRIVESKLTSRQMFEVVVHFTLVFAIMAVVTWQAARLVGAQERLRRAMTSAVLFYNAGNFGVPAATLAFGGAGDSIQALVVMLQNTTNFTIGLALHAGGREGSHWRENVRDMLRLPMIHTLALALLWRASGWTMPFPLKESLRYLANGLVPIALVTLGAQMATLKSYRFRREMALSLFLRLVFAPLLAFALVRAMGIGGILAKSLIVAASFPTAVNSALIAIEYDNEPDFSAAVVFYSTLASVFTVSFVIYAVKNW